MPGSGGKRYGAMQRGGRAFYVASDVGDDTILAVTVVCVVSFLTVGACIVFFVGDVFGGNSSFDPCDADDDYGN